jgi:nanoRNase/pAp phosphatase (c-di-AMP/oligoRNAs hydrolase)
VSVRRKVRTDIKCDMIARKLNGRGHSYAAAGIIKSHSELLKVPRVIKNCKLFYEIHN